MASQRTIWTMLKHKYQWYGSKLVVLDPEYTSLMRSDCGAYGLRNLDISPPQKSSVAMPVT
jgi:transposase